MWLRKLQESLDLVVLATVTGTDAPVKDSETVVGHASDEVKRLWAVRNELDKEGRDLLAELMARHIRGDCNEVACNADKLQVGKIRNDTRIVDQILWATITAEYDLAGSNVGLRADWQVVKFGDGEQEDEVPSIARQLANLLGVDLDSIKVVHEETMEIPKGLSRMLGGLVGLVRR